ncbi:hypothetical protein ACHWQZ_G010144 [Mnemiopsis leidyi]
MNGELTESAANSKTEGDNPSAGRKACTYSREKRSIYSGLESLEQRSARLSKQRIRNRKNQVLKTEEEKRIQRDIFNAQMRKRRASESSNQKFWRLIRRRQYRKHGVHLLCVEFQYHRSKNQYGLNNNDVSDRDNTGNSSNIIEVTDIVLGVQEHRIVHNEEIRTERLDKGAHLITSSAWRNGRQAATGGVGFVLAKKAYKAVSLMKSYGKRIFLISFDGNPRLTVITAYSPTEAATCEAAEDFHEELRNATRDVPAHHLLMVAGDLNAHLSKLKEEDSGW